jgi:hypothetical protein
MFVFRPLIEEILTVDEITVDEFGDNFSVSIPIGEGDNTYLVLVCEAKLIAYEVEEFYEFSFHFELVPGEGEDDPDPENAPDVEELWTEASVAPYKPVELAGQMLSQVCECYKALVPKVDKFPIYRVTYGVIDPENVPQRHEVLTNVLQNEGYEISEEGTDDQGRQFWMMTPAV